MWRVVTSTFVALTFISSVAAAQQPCTSDASRVVAEIYRHTLERGVDAGAQRWQQSLANGSMNVREVVRAVAKAPEYEQRFWRTEAGEGQPFERAVARLYRHLLGRQPDEGGVRTWANVAQQRGIDAVVDGLINSAEYNNNFGDWAVPGSGGLRFCQNGAGQSGQSSSAAPAPAPAGLSRDEQRRFRVMDTNNDGVIQRNEWRGSPQSFRVHDWNRDGVLNGDEVAAGAFRQGRNLEYEDFDRAEEFANLDTNNNNRIEEREWHASLRAFDQLDSNNDGVLTRNEFVRGNDTAATTGQSITVGGDRQWVDTGITVRAGETVSINADGRIRLSNNQRDVATAAGSTAGRRIQGAQIPSAPAGALIARIGNNDPVFVGDTRSFRAPRGGRLYLGVNDDSFDDNTGQYNVTVDIR
jgi:Ca2+-binding EF-hand superfamily protein